MRPPDDLLIFRNRDQLIFEPGVFEIIIAPEVVGSEIIVERTIIGFDHDRPRIPICEVQRILLFTQAREQQYPMSTGNILDKSRDLDIARHTRTFIPIHDVVRDQDRQETNVGGCKVTAIVQKTGGNVGSRKIRWGDCRCE